MAYTPPTAQRLREVLDYGPETGIFTWKVQLSRKGPVGARAGHAGPGGRWVINLDGDVHYATRLAWLYVTGQWPSKLIVQNGGIRAEVPFADLQEKTSAELRAEGGPTSLNKSGFKGVSWSKTAGRWIATITRDGRQHHLGKFVTKEDAAEAYRQAATGGALPGKGSARDPDWKTSRRQRSASWADIQFNPGIVGWDTLDAFLAEMGPPPTAEHALYRSRYDLPLGPGNAAWRLPWSRREGHEADPRRSYNYNLKHPNAAPDQWPRLFIEQNGGCAICNEPETTPFKSTIRRLAQDHDHHTGDDRGLLCVNCNNGLGRFNDDPERLRAAADYIEKWRTHHGRTAADYISVDARSDKGEAE